MTSALFLATYESRHFSFEGVGASEAEARDVLKQGLRAHGAQCRLVPDDWWNETGLASAADLFNVRMIERGTAYRDGSPLD